MKTYQLLATTVMAASAVLALPAIATDQTVHNPRVEALSQPATVSIEPGQSPQDARSVVLDRIQRGTLDVMRR